MRMIRVIRGILGTALAWGIAWVPLTSVWWGTVALLGGSVPPFRFWLPILASSAIRGAISGAAFASVLAIAGRRRTFETLRLRQMMLWGAVGGLVAPMITVGAIVLSDTIAVPPLFLGLSLGFSSALGALSAAGTLWAARRAPQLSDSSHAAIDAPVPAGAALAGRVE